MIEEAYVSFETAKLLKEKGFNEPVTELNKLLFKKGEKPILKITQQKAMKWLRETHTLFIEITIDLSDGAYPMYNAKIVNLKTCDNHYVLGYDRYRYEEAVETAIINCLELI